MSQLTVINENDEITMVITNPPQTNIIVARGPGPQGATGESNVALIGVMADLSTDDKDTLVGAINEINIPSPSLKALYNNAKAG